MEDADFRLAMTVADRGWRSLSKYYQKTLPIRFSSFNAIEIECLLYSFFLNVLYYEIKKQKHHRDWTKNVFLRAP